MENSSQCDSGVTEAASSFHGEGGQSGGTLRMALRADIAKDVRRRLRHAIKSGGSRASLPDSLKLACHERHPGGFHDVYGVMDWNMPSPTITSGCTNASKGRFGHPKQARPLTAVEAAALQSFPRAYKFKGSGLESVA